MTHTIEENEQRRAVIGIDVSKDKFDACCIDGNGKELFHVSALWTARGLTGWPKRFALTALFRVMLWQGWNPQVVII